MQVLLPNSHPLVDQIIRWEHLQNCHAGVQMLMGKLREKMWIIQGRRAIRKIVKKCVKCRRFSAKSPATYPAPLPEDRIKDSKVFEVVGVDLAGPVFLRNHTKAWIVLYTCAVYRCVHLELVSSLSTEAFLWSLQRFVDRRGRPDTVYSDNGTNFVGAVNLFKTIDWEKVEKEAQVKRINWKFSPPTGAWWGGWWERLIRVMKDLLKRMLGNARLTYEEMATLLCDAEAVMNARPLTYISEDQDDLVPRTPSMFLQDIVTTETPEMTCPGGDELRKRLRIRQQLKMEIRSRFRKEYLSQLVQKGKDPKSLPINVGDIVLVGAENKKRLKWPMAKVIELFQGKDGHVRVAKVKTANGELIRPIPRLFPLEVSSVVKDIHITEKIKKTAASRKEATRAEELAVKTRCGRQIKKPMRLGIM